jgi:hypothetical protein
MLYSRFTGSYGLGKGQTDNQLEQPDYSQHSFDQPAQLQPGAQAGHQRASVAWHTTNWTQSVLTPMLDSALWLEAHKEADSAWCSEKTTKRGSCGFE